MKTEPQFDATNAGNVKGSRDGARCELTVFNGRIRRIDIAVFAVLTMSFCFDGCACYSINEMGRRYYDTLSSPCERLRFYEAFARGTALETYADVFKGANCGSRNLDTSIIIIVIEDLRSRTGYAPMWAWNRPDDVPRYIGLDIDRDIATLDSILRCERN